MKRLITADVIRQEHQAGKKQLEITLPLCIVTPEARLVAQELGFGIIETIANQEPIKVSKPQETEVSVCKSTEAPNPELAMIRAAVMAKLPEGSVTEEVIDQLVKKIANEKKPQTTAIAEQTTNDNVQTVKGIKRIKGCAVQFGIFEGAGSENQVGIADVVGAEDGSSMGAGFMSWKNCFFPWTLTYDEVNIVLEGELHIRCENQTLIAKAGDVFFIPKNSTIEFGTPTSVRFFYVSYPANWQDC